MINNSRLLKFMQVAVAASYGASLVLTIEQWPKVIEWQTYARFSFWNLVMLYLVLTL